MSYVIIKEINLLLFKMRFIRIWSGSILLPKIIYFKNTKYKRYAVSNHYKRYCFRLSIKIY